MKRFLACLTVCLLLCAAHVALAEKPKVLYFYDEQCGSCYPEIMFIDTFEEMTGQSIADYDYQHYNVMQTSGMAALESAAERYGIDEADWKMPLAVIDGIVYIGEHEIQTALPARFLEAEGSTGSLIYYLSVPACESCARAKAVLRTLPESIALARGEVTFTSDVTVREIDLSAQLGMAQALYAHYGVPEDKQLAPMVFLGDRYYQGADAIEARLLDAVVAGGALGTPVLAQDAPADMSGLTILGSLAAGLVGGLNPCALSMLLLVLSILASLPFGAGRLSAAFLISKLVTYFLIGTLLLAVFQRWSPSWLPLATKILLTVLSLALIALNLHDAWQARHERYGQVRNQLPTGLRARLQARIQTVLSRPGGPVLMMSAGLGVLVAAGEFLCAGQVYLATLLAALHAGTTPGASLLMLACYCAAFLLPSTVLSVVVLRGRSAFAVSSFVRERMPLIKVITAVFFIVLLVLVWTL